MYCTIAVILVRFQSNLNILERVSEKHIYKISGKSVQWEPSGYIRTDGRKDKETDMAKLIVTFRNFVNAPKNGIN